MVTQRYLVVHGKKKDCYGCCVSYENRNCFEKYSFFFLNEGFPIQFRYFCSASGLTETHNVENFIQYSLWKSSIHLLLIFGSIIFFRRQKLQRRHKVKSA